MKMKMLSASSILGVILCSTFIFSCTKNQTNIAVSGVTLNKTSLSITEGNSETLIATVSPTTANQAVTWKSSDDAVATVSSGKVTAVAKGVASITATSVGNISKAATCAVTVNHTDVAVSGVTLNKTSLSITEGNSETLIATVTPTTANQAVTWKSSDDAVATVSSGKVTAVAKGVASITATSVGNISKAATCAVTVVAGTVSAGARTFTLTSTSFTNNGVMGSKHAYLDASGNPQSNINISPQLSWTGAPTTGVSKFIVMMYDATVHFSHFSYAISSTITSLAEGDIPSNTNTNPGYIGPYPLDAPDYHIYEFRVYAVSAGYDLDDFKQSPESILKSKSAKYILAYSDPGYLGKFKY